MSHIYGTIFTFVLDNIGAPIAKMLSLTHYWPFVITHSINWFLFMFIVFQILSFITSLTSKGGTSSVSNKGGASSSGKNMKGKKYLLICGPTNSGKTTLFYHILTKDVRITVS